MTELYCKKRKEIVNIPTSQDYCVDCEHYEIIQDCWACDLEVKYINNGEKVVKLPIYYSTHKTSFGAYTTDRKEKPLRVFFNDGQELNISNMNVVIHDNGIEFIK